MGEIICRPMDGGDIERSVEALGPLSADKLRKLLGTYLAEQERGLRTAIAAEYVGGLAGYVTLIPSAKTGTFKNRGIPQVHDLIVFEKFRRRGIGTELMNRVEAEAALKADEICLGVGLGGINGAAQRFFVTRGYVPDGSGVWCGRSPARPFDTVENVGVLTLYMSKKLR